MFRLMNERIVLAVSDNRTAALTEARSQSLRRRKDITVWYDGELIAVSVRGLLIEIRPLPKETHVPEPVVDLNELEWVEGRCTESCADGALRSAGRKAVLRGYEPGPCPQCRQRTLVRSGALARCDTCGTFTENCA